MLECEEKYEGFFSERSLFWEPSPSKRAMWRSKGAECKELVVARKWVLEFALHSMNPSSAGPLTKSLKSAVRATTDYEFDLNSLSDDEDVNDDIEVIDSDESEDRVSITGIIWKDLGKDAFDKWLEYLKTARNSNELYLCCKLLSRLFEESYVFIKDTENEKENRKPQQQNLSLRQAKAKCIKLLKKDAESESDESDGDIEEDEKEELPKDPPMKIKWNDDCYKCGEEGDLLCCDTCPNVAHLACIGLKQAPSGMWQCENCLNKEITSRQTRSRTKRLQKLSEFYDDTNNKPVS